MKLDALRVYVDRRLSAATDDIFRCFAETVHEYERDVFRLKQEVLFHRKLLESAGLTPVPPPAEEQERGGASTTEDADFLLTPDWLRETPDRDLSLPPNQIQTYGQGAGPQGAGPQGAGPQGAGPQGAGPQGAGPPWTERCQEAFGLKQEVAGGHVTLEPSGRHEQEEEEEQLKGRSFHLPVKQEEGGGASGSEEFSPSPDWLIGDEGACLSAHADWEGPAQRHGQSSEDSEDPADTGSPSGPGAPEWPSGPGAPAAPSKSFGCLVCGNSFSSRGLLVRHAENHCKDPGSRCGVCGGRPGPAQTLRDHLRGHRELGSTCDVCGRKCGSMGKLEVHRRVHTGEKPFSCSFCGRDFSRKGSLERHLKVHTGARPHPCGLCGSTYTRREYLLHHLRTGHPECRQQTEAGGAGGGGGLRTKNLRAKSKR